MKTAIAMFVLEKQEVTVSEVLDGIGLRDRGRAAEMRVAETLKELGWTRGPRLMRNGVRSVYWSRPEANDQQAIEKLTIIQKAGQFDYEGLVDSWPREVVVRLLAKYIKRELEAPDHWFALMGGEIGGPAN